MPGSPTPSATRRRITAIAGSLSIAACLVVGGPGGSTAPAAAAGAGSVSGVVRTDAGAPVPQAHVRLRNAGLVGITDSNGGYTISNVPFGTDTLDVSAPCRTGSTTAIAIDGAETTNVDVGGAFLFDGFGHACRPAGSGFTFPDQHTTLALSGDDASASVNLPFSFPYYGSIRNTLNVSTNGYLTFGAASSRPTNTQLLNAATPTDGVYVFWDDLEVDAAAAVQTGQTTVAGKGRAFVVSWVNVAFHNDPSSGRITTQVALFESGRIEMAWSAGLSNPRTEGGSATIGIRNPSTGPGNDALEQSFDTASLVKNLRVEYLTNRLPVARAGADQTVASGAAFELDGTGSTDPEGPGGLVFRWEQVAGPVSSIADPNASKTTVTGQPGPKTFTYRLTVTDPFGRSSLDDVTVSVQQPAPK